jgi:hypothetical protein
VREAEKKVEKPMKPLPKWAQATNAGKLSNLSYCNAPEAWAAWYSQNLDNTKVSRPGVVINLDGLVPLWHIRGMLLVGRHAPSRANPAYEQNHTKYSQCVVELLIMLGKYEALVTNWELTIVKPQKREV